MRFEITETETPRGTMLEAVVNGHKLWRIARRPEKLEHKRIQMQRDIELAKRGIFPQEM